MELERKRQLKLRSSFWDSFRVIVALPYWALSGTSIFSANLVRGLLDSGIAAEILLTEQETERVIVPDPLLPQPTDIPVHKLPVSKTANWGAHWQGMIQYLEERAPCIYIPTYDWRHSIVSPRLSNRVGIIGTVRSDDPLHYDHVARLGQYWNAIVCV